MAKGKGGSNSEAMTLQKESLRQSQLNSALMDRRMVESIEATKAMKLPAFQGPSPIPRMGSQDMALRALETRNNLRRRSGLDSTTYAGA